MFIDIHLHTVPRKGLPRNADGDNYASPEELIEIMDRTGVDRGVLLPGVSPECSAQPSPPQSILEVCEAHPDRFFAFCNVDPRAEANSPGADLSRQLRYYKERGCRGVGEVTANLAFTDPLVLNLFEHCRRCAMPVLFHIGPAFGGCYGLVDSPGLPGLERCLKLFPELPFIGHSQPFWAEISGDSNPETRGGYPAGPVAPGGAVPRLLRGHRNLYCDISARSGYNALTRDAGFGAAFLAEFHERIMFGTDTCSVKNNFRHADLLRRLRDEGKLGGEAFENISWRNANRLFGLGL